MVDDDELERHVRRVDDELAQSGDANLTRDERVEELEATVMRVAEELANRIEDIDRPAAFLVLSLVGQSFDPF